MPIVINDMMDVNKIKLLTKDNFITVKDLEELKTKSKRVINQDTPLDEQLAIKIINLDASGNPIIDNDDKINEKQVNDTNNTIMA